MTIHSAFRWLHACAATVLLVGLTSGARGAETTVCDFENDGERAFFEMKTGTASDQHVTHGMQSLKVLPGEYLTSWKVPKDWSAFDSIDLDAFVDGDDPVNGSILIGDSAWKDKGTTYWNRHNGTFNLKPGANTISIAVNGLYRGEAGSRGNDLHSNIDPKEIVRLDLGFTTAGKVAAIYLDHLRLVKGTKPDGLLAFDFGPESQTIYPGFAPISWNTIHGANGATAGLKFPAGEANRARDDTFPTRLYQDFVWFEENGNEFIADVPNGRCHAWLVFDDCGYWGGEAARHRRRTITANGKEVWVDDRGDAGAGDWLFRFEKIEPKPGDSLWDLYMKDLFKPARFDAEVTDGKLRIRLQSDAPWSAKVAAIIIYPDAIKAQAEPWIADIEAKNRAEFEARAVFMGPKPKPLDIPEEAKKQGCWLGYPSFDDTVTFVDAPGAEAGKLARAAARGQQLSFTFAVRPLKDYPGPVALTVTALTGPSGTIPASSLDVRYVHHQTQRTFNDVAYSIMPMGVRRVEKSGLVLTKDLTRQFIITAAVPADAKAGVYAGELALTAGDLRLKLPIAIDVLDLALDDPDFNFGFFGAWIPGDLPKARRDNGYFELASLMKRIGMNSFSGGPAIGFSGFDEAGQPKLDFAACDDYFKALRRAGMTRPVYSYGGPAFVSGLHDGYTIGDTGRGWAKQTGKPFTEVLKTVWTAVEEHAKKAEWLPVYYGMLDEPRALEPAKENLEFHRAYHDGAPFVRIGGFYSVNWQPDPYNEVIQDMFKTMYWSGLGEHAQIDLDKGREFGREVHIYNSGLTRFSFGQYQWAEMRKGVKGRMQWHTLALHGYQFFDLDGREPDPGVINWGHDEIIPTLHCVRSCEGANDFRMAVTLWNLAAKAGDSAEAKAARAFLDDIDHRIPAGHAERPAGLPADEAFREECVRRIKALSAAK
ncbi:MAG: hypothetical protein H0W83_07060 [Planctomycetes bacterium]|nr:hypothetical protein [Planctomycetota bacterium]